MKKILGYIVTFFKEQCCIPYLITIMMYAALLIWFNFHFGSLDGRSFEDVYISPDNQDTRRLMKYIIMYFLSFGVPYLLMFLFKQTRDAAKSVKLWGLILFSIIIFSVRAWFFQHSGWVQELVPMDYKVVTYKYAVNLAGFVFLFIPCFIYWLIADRKNQPVYGFHSKGVDLKPYLFLLLLMVPLLLWAAQQRDFQDVYPRAEHLNLTDKTKGHSLLTALYELCYSLDFVVTEFFFRGFLILALARYAGPKTILPMCVYYVSIHFDKPLGECISSFFGGALLGILVYNTRSIYGGIIVHLGIALLMEALGFVF